MKKREMKALQKEVRAFAVQGLGKKEKHAVEQKAKVKLPYNMYQGMQKKNKERT